MSVQPLTGASTGSLPGAGPPAVLQGTVTLDAPNATVAIAGFGWTDALAWIAIAGFLLAMGLEFRRRTDHARYVAAGAWALFGIFWVTMVPYFYYDAQSPLQTILAAVALPLCLYAGYLLVQGRDSLLLLSRAVAFMGIIYLPAETIPLFRQWLIETVTWQTHLGMELLGHSPGINEGANGYQSRFDFDSEATATGRTTYIVLACTGIGSISIFGGLIAAVKAPLRRKLAGFVLAVGVIWILNLARNVFVGLATPHGWFQYDALVYLVTTTTGSVPERTSFLVAHNYIAQPLSIVALVAITFLVIKIVPEVLEILEDLLYILTGSEYDLEEAFGSDPIRADGGATTVDDSVSTTSNGEPATDAGERSADGGE